MLLFLSPMLLYAGCRWGDRGLAHHAPALQPPLLLLLLLLPIRLPPLPLLLLLPLLLDGCLQRLHHLPGAGALAGVLGRAALLQRHNLQGGEVG